MSRLVSACRRRLGGRRTRTASRCFCEIARPGDVATDAGGTRHSIACRGEVVLTYPQLEKTVMSHASGFAISALFAQDAAGPGLGIWFPLILVGLCYYLIVFRPEKQLRAQHAELLKNLKKNDRVITSGGIHGTVVNAAEGAADVVIRIDENTNTRIHVQRASISKVVTDGDEAQASSG